MSSSCGQNVSSGIYYYELNGNNMIVLNEKKNLFYFELEIYLN